jgi:hypothetical protein
MTSIDDSAHSSTSALWSSNTYVACWIYVAHSSMSRSMHSSFRFPLLVQQKVCLCSQCFTVYFDVLGASKTSNRFPNPKPLCRRWASRSGKRGWFLCSQQGCRSPPRGLAPYICQREKYPIAAAYHSSSLAAESRPRLPKGEYNCTRDQS